VICRREALSRLAALLSPKLTEAVASLVAFAYLVLAPSDGAAEAAAATACKALPPRDPPNVGDCLISARALSAASQGAYLDDLDEGLRECEAAASERGRGTCARSDRRLGHGGSKPLGNRAKRGSRPADERPPFAESRAHLSKSGKTTGGWPPPGLQDAISLWGFRDRRLEATYVAWTTPQYRSVSTQISTIAGIYLDLSSTH
jgi:hypothetical protein